MAIYISKNAINKNPFVTKEIDKEEGKTPILRSKLLQTEYLKALVASPKRIKYLQKGNTNNDRKSIIRIKLALNTVDAFYRTIDGTNEYEIPGGGFSHYEIEHGSFDSKLEEAIKAFQRFIEINDDGKVNPETVRGLDNFINDDIRYDLENHKLLGKRTNKDILIPSYKETTNSDGTKSYEYRLKIGDIEVVYNLDVDKLPVTPLQSKDGEFYGEITNEKIKTQMDPNSSSFQSFSHLNPIISLEGQETIDERLIKPPKIFGDDQARLHTIQSDDTVLKLIKEEYYNNQEVQIKNPLSDNDEAIYTLKAQTLHENPATREHDAKLQFYINLVYYCNSIEDKDGALTEYGIYKSNAYERYDNDHLLEFNMYANTLDPNNPESALPNYYRFLKYQERKNSRSKIIFDESGEVDSFLLNEGKKMYIPSREFADSLYYHISFRHDEMLVETETGYEYVDENSFIDTIINTLISWGGAVADVVEFVVDETRKLLGEVVAFFKEAYKFAKELMKEWWRGLGGSLGTGLGATFGIFAGDFETTSVLYRKMTKQEEKTLVLAQYKTGRVGGDVGIGGAIGIPKASFGKKRSRLTAGLQLGAGASRGLKFSFTGVYEFPVRQEETAVLALFIQIFGGTITKLAAKMASSIAGLGIDPDQYLTKMKVGLSVETDVWGAAQVGFKEDKPDEADPKKNINHKPSTNTAPLTDALQGVGHWLSKNILKIVSGVGIGTQGNFSYGSEVEYEAKYDDKPLVPQKNDRIPSETKVKVLFFCSAQMATNGLGSFIKRMLLSNNILRINPFLSLLNFEHGLAFGNELTFKRTSKAKEMTVNDVNILERVGEENYESIAITNSNGKAKYGNDKAAWETQIFLSHFTGDVDLLFTAGNEATLKLNTYALIQRLRNFDTFFSFETVESILQFVDSVELQMKPSLLAHSEKYGRMVFTEKTLENMNQGFKKGNRGDFVSRKSIAQYKSKKGSLTADVYAGMYIKVEFKIANLVDLFGYYIRYWYLKLKAETEIQDREFVRKIKNWLSTELSVEIRNFYDDVSQTTDKILSKKQYEDLFKRLNPFIEEFYTANQEKFTPNFTSVVKDLLNITRYLLQYLSNTDFILNPVGAGADAATKLYKSMDIKRFAPALASIADIIETEMYVDTKLGINAGLNISGAVGVKLRLKLMFNAAMVFVYQIVENNKIIFLEDEDPDKDVLERLAGFIGVDKETGQVTGYDSNGEGIKEIRKSIIRLPS